MAGLRSEDELGVKWDRCLADTGIKLLGGDCHGYRDGDPGDPGDDNCDDNCGDNFDDNCNGDLDDSDGDLGHPDNGVNYLGDGNIDQEIVTGIYSSLFLFI